MALWVLHRTLQEHHFASLVEDLRAVPPSALLLALGFSVASYLVLTGYDALALRYVGHHLSYQRIAAVLQGTHDNYQIDLFRALIHTIEELTGVRAEGQASHRVIADHLRASSFLVADGVLQGYMLASYSARKLGMTSTGNAGGNHNLILKSGNLDLDGLLCTMHTGLLVTELLGHGVNLVTGDYSRGAAGFWVENGQIQYPVEEITIAGNLKEMFMQLAAVGNDVLVQGSKQTGSILIERMTVAGESDASE